MPGGIDYSKWDKLDVSDDDEEDVDQYEEEDMDDLPLESHLPVSKPTGIDYSRFDKIFDEVANPRPRVTRYDAYVLTAKTRTQLCRLDAGARVQIGSGGYSISDAKQPVRITTHSRVANSVVLSPYAVWGVASCSA
eukprot:1183606-Prorocentrum_minimum.AAC.4